MAHFWDLVAAVSITILLIIGGYQVYFMPQRAPMRRPVQLMTWIDEKIPFRPRWVWVYSFLYYPFIVSVILTLDDFRHYAFTVLSYIILLMLQVIIAYLLPVKTPPSWRTYNPRNSLSERFLSVVHHYDSGGNCFPSMHCAVATLTALHLLANIGTGNAFLSSIVIISTLLIFVSTVFTKQHFILDIPAGAALAGIVYWLYQLIY